MAEHACPVLSVFSHKHIDIILFLPLHLNRLALRVQRFLLEKSRDLSTLICKDTSTSLNVQYRYAPLPLKISTSAQLFAIPVQQRESHSHSWSSTSFRQRSQRATGLRILLMPRFFLLHRGFATSSIEHCFVGLLIELKTSSRSNITTLNSTNVELLHRKHNQTPGTATSCLPPIHCSNDTTTWVPKHKKRSFLCGSRSHVTKGSVGQRAGAQYKATMGQASVRRCTSCSIATV